MLSTSVPERARRRNGLGILPEGAERSACLEQIVHRDAEPVDPCADRGPLLADEALALLPQQGGTRAGRNEHADPASHLDLAVLLELLVGLGDGERVGAFLRRERAYRREHLAFPIAPVDDRGGDLVAQLQVDRAGVGIAHG